MREGYRNRPEKVLDGKHVGYGALTGESAAEAFLDVGSIPLELGDVAVLYSDGFWPTVCRDDFFSIINQPSSSVLDQKLVPFSLSLARQDPELFGKERTLICVVF